MVGTLYKVSQMGSRYAHSTSVAFKIAKLAISLTLHANERPKQQSVMQAFRARCDSLKKPQLVFRIAAPAGMYFTNYQLTFLLFLHADPASINLLKAGSSAISMGKVVSQQQ